MVVLTRNAPTTYYEGRDGLAGIEYEMATQFAYHLGVPVRFEVLDSVSAILEALREGRGDIAAAGLTRTREREDSFLFSRPYQSVEQQVVCRREGARPRQVSDLAGLRMTLIASSSYVERMRELQSDYSEISWKTTDKLDTEELLEKVWSGEIDCTVADSNITAVNRRYYPELTVPMVITDPEPLAWAMPKKARYLQATVNAWFREFEETGALDDLLERYYGHVDRLDYVDLRVFNRRVRALLPQYRALFESAALQYNLPWTLLAAQAYQESHWDPEATSPTGVRGIMMLTLDTATGLGVTDRLNPHQSIMGGARYLADLYARLDPSIQEPDRTWIALAAYNVGLSHVHDAQILARKLDKDPNSWNDLKSVLPLLAQKRYYRNLEHGYARGREPVRYVHRVRHFYDLMEKAVVETPAPQQVSDRPMDSGKKPAEPRTAPIRAL